VYQVLSDMIDQGMPLASAVAAPRLHHQASPDMLYLESDGFVRASIDSLEAMGHKISFWNYKTEVNAIARAAGAGSAWPIPARRRRGWILRAARLGRFYRERRVQLDGDRRTLGITMSMSRDCRAAAAPAAAPAAPPMRVPFLFFPRSLPTIAPATAPRRPWRRPPRSPRDPS